MRRFLFATPILAAAVGLLTICFHLEAAAETGFSRPPGQLWSQISVSHWSSDERFAGPYGQGDLTYDGGREVGDRLPISIDERGGTFVAQNIALTTSLGVTNRLDVGGYLPLRQRSVLTLESGEVENTGVGDLWLHGGWRITPDDASVSSRVVTELKIPLSETSFEVLTVPLSEGQLDVALGQVTTWSSEVGVHLTGGMKFRYRAPVTQEVGAVEFQLKPGNEFVLLAEVAGEPLSNTWLSLSWRSTLAQTSEGQSLSGSPEPRERREIHSLGLGTYVSVGRWLPPSLTGLAISGNAQLPVAGVDQLAGPTLTAGLAWQTELWK